jgi:protein-tyrosine phosphatase
MITLEAMDWFSTRPDGHARPTRDGRRPSVTEISGELLVGEYPDHQDIAWLKENYAITAVHNLQDDEDLRINGLDPARLRAEYQAHRIRFVRTPIQDGSADAMAARLEAALADLSALVEENERVYLHCNAGMNRAPTLAIAFLRARRGMSLEEAMLHVKRRRPCGPFMTVLEDYFGPRHHKPDR